MDRFLLAENPMNEVPHRHFILHTLYPKMLIECIYLNDEPEVKDLNAIFDLYEHQTKVEGIMITENWQLIVRQYYDHKDVDSVEDYHVIKYRKTITKAWHWFKAYLEWEDENIDENESAQNN